MDSKDYQDFVESMWRRKDNPLEDLYIMSTGLAGETGEVLEHLKKHVRDGQAIDIKELTLELGDVVYYATRIALRFHIPLDDVLKANVEKLTFRRKYGKAAEKPVVSRV